MSGILDLYPFETEGPAVCVPYNQVLALGCLQELGCNLLGISGKVTPIR